jgi:hypothetical protein
MYENFRLMAFRLKNKNCLNKITFFFLQPLLDDPSPKVTKELMQKFYEDGFVVIPGACSSEVTFCVFL